MQLRISIARNRCINASQNLDMLKARVTLQDNAHAQFIASPYPGAIVVALLLELGSRLLSRSTESLTLNAGK